MFFAKYINESCIIRCPRNGYAGKRAVSNLNRFFERNPGIAAEEGYMEFIPLGEETEGTLCYRVENGKILEGVKANDDTLSA